MIVVQLCPLSVYVCVYFPHVLLPASCDENIPVSTAVVGTSSAQKPLDGIQYRSLGLGLNKRRCWCLRWKHAIEWLLLGLFLQYQVAAALHM